MKSSKANFVTWNFRLPPKSQLSILLIFFFSLIDIDIFSQVLNFTSVELNRFAKQAKLFFLKNPLFQKRRWSCNFPPWKTPVAQKHRAISRQEKMALSTPRLVVLGLPSPSPRVCTDGRARTLTSQPKFLWSIGYQNVLTNGAPLARCARVLRHQSKQ